MVPKCHQRCRTFRTGSHRDYEQTHTLLYSHYSFRLLFFSVCIEMLAVQSAFSRTTRLAGPCLVDMLSSVASSRAVATSVSYTHRSNTTVKSITLRRPIWLMHHKLGNVYLVTSHINNHFSRH